MSILTLRDGKWQLDAFLEPVEFWPYPTYIRDSIMTGPRDVFQHLQDFLVTEFNNAGIKAYAENKSAFGLRDGNKIWYLGFKDFNFLLGASVSSDWKTPIRNINPHDVQTFRPNQ